MAFSVSHLGGAEPTLHNLAELERKELAALSKAAASKATKVPPQHPPSAAYEATAAAGFGVSVFGSSAGGALNDDETDFMDSYVTKTPQVSAMRSVFVVSALCGFQFCARIGLRFLCSKLCSVQ